MFYALVIVLAVILAWSIARYSSNIAEPAAGLGEQEASDGESLPMCQAAYAQVMAAIEAPPQALRDMFMPLVEAHRSGSPRQAKQVVLHYLPAGTWRWPAYAAMETTREREGYAASVQEIEQFSTEDLFARAYTVPQLLALYKLRAPGAKLPGRKKAEVLAAVTALLPEEEMLATAERIRANMLESLRQQHEDDLSEMENVADYGSMAQWLAHRFSMTVSALRRRNEILRMDGFYSHVEFQAYARGGAAAACQRLHGQRFALGDPAWQNWQSCGFPECACGFRGRLAKGENLPAVSAENGRNRSVNAAHAKNKPCKHHVE